MQDVYGQVLVRLAVLKDGTKLVCFSAKFIPLYKTDKRRPKRNFNYDRFMLIEDTISLNQLIEFFGQLISTNQYSFKIGDYDIEFRIISNFLPAIHYTEMDYLHVGWSYELYQFNFNTIG